MTFEERIDRLADRHEALTQSVEMLNRDIRELRAIVEIDAENIRRLAHIAEIHERRISDLEGEG